MLPYWLITNKEENAPKYVWRGLCAPPNPLAAMGSLLLRGGMEREGWMGRGVLIRGGSLLLRETKGGKGGDRVQKGREREFPPKSR